MAGNSKKNSDPKDAWIFDEVKKQLDYEFDVVELSIPKGEDDVIKIPLFGKEWSIALQISLINAMKDIFSLSNEDNNDITLETFEKWLRLTLDYLNDQKQAFVNKKNPIKRIFATTKIKRNPNYQNFITEFKIKELNIFIALNNSIDEYEFTLSALKFKELQSEFYRWLNKFLYDLSRPVYDIIGQDLDNAVRSRPGGDVLRIYLSSILGSPFQLKEELPNGKIFNYGIKQVNIPYPKKITYRELRQACGGNDGIFWGHFTCRGWILADDTRAIKEARQLTVSGYSEKDAIANYEKFFQFTNGVENNRRIGENKSENDPIRKKKLKKYLVYPKNIFVEKTAYFQFGVPSLTDGYDTTRTISQGTKKSLRYNVPIYSENESPDFKIAMEALNV